MNHQVLLTLDEVSSVLSEYWGLKVVEGTEPRALPSYENQNWFVEATGGLSDGAGVSQKYVLRAQKSSLLSKDAFEGRMHVISELHKRSQPVPFPVPHRKEQGDTAEYTLLYRDGLYVLSLVTFIEGQLLSTAFVERPTWDEKIDWCQEAGTGVTSFSDKRNCTSLYQTSGVFPAAIKGNFACQDFIQLGKALGSFTNALNDACKKHETHPLTSQERTWDLQYASELANDSDAVTDIHNAFSQSTMASSCTSYSDDEAEIPDQDIGDGDQLKELVDCAFKEFDEFVNADYPKCRRGWIHGDCNDNNIIMDRRQKRWFVASFVDYEDLCYSKLINELAICLAYAMMDSPDPVAVGSLILRGFHETSPLNEAEIRVLPRLIRARLAVSLVMSSKTTQTNVSNDHLPSGTKRRKLQAVVNEPGSSYTLIHSIPAKKLLRFLSLLPNDGLVQHFGAICGLQIDLGRGSEVEYIKYAKSNAHVRGEPIRSLQENFYHIAQKAWESGTTSLVTPFLFGPSFSSEGGFIRTGQAAATWDKKPDLDFPRPKADPLSPSAKEFLARLSGTTAAKSSNEAPNQVTLRPFVCDFTGSNSGSWELLMHVVGPEESSVKNFTTASFLCLLENDVGVSWGRWGEQRLIYQSDLFNSTSPEEARTVHLGIDLGAVAGTPCFTPFDGEVLSISNNAQALDYGPTIIIRHWLPLDVNSFFEFHTLYGHLSEESISSHRIKEGQYLRSGDLVGWIGPYTVNGGWPPHLHFQAMVEPDLGGKRGDYPGVATRGDWESSSQYLLPNPDVILQFGKYREGVHVSRNLSAR